MESIEKYKKDTDISHHVWQQKGFFAHERTEEVSSR
jgi:hypothetical protein